MDKFMAAMNEVAAGKEMEKALWGLPRWQMRDFVKQALDDRKLLESMAAAGLDPAGVLKRGVPVAQFGLGDTVYVVERVDCNECERAWNHECDSVCTMCPPPNPPKFCEVWEIRAVVIEDYEIYTNDAGTLITLNSSYVAAPDEVKNTPEEAAVLLAHRKAEGNDEL